MTPFRDLPIRQKLLLIAMLTTAVALVAAGSTIVFADSLLFQAFLRRDLSALARIVAENSTAALSFQDPQAAGETLASLHSRVHVVGACLYDAAGVQFAVYRRSPGFNCPAPSQGERIRESRDALYVSEPVVLRGSRIGTLVFVYDLGEIDERIALYGSLVLAVLLGSGIIAFALSSRLRSLVSAPIAALVEAAMSVSETGDYGIRARKVGNDELGLLADRFNDMLTRIEQRENELKRAIADRETALRDVERERQRVRFMAESMPQKIFTALPDGSVDYFNAQWMEYTGLTFEQIRDWGWTRLIHPDDLEENVRLWRHSVETGEPFHLEHRFRRADGVYRWHLSRARAMRDSGGRILMWIGSNTEIQEQKEKEADLRRANEDLQQFAYSASHDLQEPIRNVAVYSEIVADRYSAQLDEDGRQFLEFIREGGRRLAVLVNDLLAYTRASMAELTETTIDSAAALRNAVSNLSEAIRESSAVVTWDALPEVHMGEAHLQQVFQNLVANAVKYRSAAPPAIHISALRAGDFWRFSVQDNGIGIDPKYRERIFGVFKRLHHDRKYSGTGIGLAICQRVIERYGGRIWVESEPGLGATFYFTIPVRPQQSGPAKLASAAG